MIRTDAGTGIANRIESGIVIGIGIRMVTIETTSQSDWGQHANHLGFSEHGG